MRQQTWDGSRLAQIENIKRQSLNNESTLSNIQKITCIILRNIDHKDIQIVQVIL